MMRMLMHIVVCEVCRARIKLGIAMAEQADDGHNDHDFHQRETRFRVISNIFHGFVFLTGHGGTKQPADLYE